MEKVERLHFLIHPGYISENHVPDIPGNTVPPPQDILDRYIEGARTMGSREIMAVFLHATKSDLRKDVPADKPYVSALRDIRSVLGRRMVVLSFDWDTFPRAEGDIPKTVRQVQLLANKRGFHVDEATPTVAYGEYLDACVCQCAEALNAGGNFASPTVIDTRRSDYCLLTDQEIREAVSGKRSVEPLPHVLFDCEIDQ